MALTHALSCASAVDAPADETPLVEENAEARDVWLAQSADGSFDVQTSTGLTFSEPSFDAAERRIDELVERDGFVFAGLTAPLDIETQAFSAPGDARDACERTTCTRANALERKPTLAKFEKAASGAIGGTFIVDRGPNADEVVVLGPGAFQKKSKETLHIDVLDETAIKAWVYEVSRRKLSDGKLASTDAPATFALGRGETVRTLLGPHRDGKQLYDGETKQRRPIVLAYYAVPHFEDVHKKALKLSWNAEGNVQVTHLLSVVLDPDGVLFPQSDGVIDRDRLDMVLARSERANPTAKVANAALIRYDFDAARAANRALRDDFRKDIKGNPKVGDVRKLIHWLFVATLVPEKPEKSTENVPLVEQQLYARPALGWGIWRGLARFVHNAMIPLNPNRAPVPEEL